MQVICYLLYTSILPQIYFFNIVGIASFYHCFLHHFSMYFLLLTSMLTFMKIHKNILGQNKTNKVLLGTENAFKLLTSSLLHVSHVRFVLNLPLRQKGGFCIWNTVFYLFMVSLAAYPRKSGLLLHSRWNVMILEKYGTNLSEEKTLN